MQNQGAQQNSSTGDKKMNDKSAQSPNGQLVVGIVVSLIIGFIIGWAVTMAYYRHHNAGMMENAVDMTGTTGTSTSFLVSSSGISTTSPGSITVASQPAGFRVFVSSVTFGNTGGWVSIQDDNNGVPGRILGAAAFGVGSTAGEVPLLRATAVGHSYFAVMRANVGDSKIFNMETDEPLMDSSGNTVMTTFMAR